MFSFLIESGETNLHEKSRKEFLLSEKDYDTRSFCDLYNQSISDLKASGNSTYPVDLANYLCEHHEFSFVPYTCEILTKGIHHLTEVQVDSVDYKERVHYKDTEGELYYYKIAHQEYEDEPVGFICLVHENKFSEEEFVTMYNKAMKKMELYGTGAHDEYELSEIMVHMYKFRRLETKNYIRTLQEGECEPVQPGDFDEDRLWQFTVKQSDSFRQRCSTCEYRAENGCYILPIPFPALGGCSTYIEEMDMYSNYDNDNYEKPVPCCENAPNCECDID